MLRYPFYMLLILAVMVPVSAARAGEFLNHAVGDTISKAEADEYMLFQDETDFQVAYFTRDDHRRYFLIIHHRSPSGEMTEETIQVRRRLFPVLDAWLEAQHTSDRLYDTLSTPCSVVTYQMEAIGQLLSWRGRTLMFDFGYGPTEIPIGTIDDIRLHRSSRRSDQYGFHLDPNRTRLFFAPTARSLDAREGYFAVYEVIFPSASVGLGYNITIGGGLSPFSSGDFQMYWLTPKVGLIETEKMSLAVGALSMFIKVPDEDTIDFGTLYGISTFGSEDAAISVGLGYGYAEGDVGHDPVFMLGGEARIGRNVKLISENWKFPGVDDPLYMFGVRWFGSRLAADFGLMRIGDMSILGVPWVDFVWNF